MAHGIVTDWHDIELLWESIFPLLKANSQEHPTLLTEAPLNPRSHRERAAELFFEAFGVPALHFATQAVLSLYASGRTTGVVLDSGDGVSHVVCVYEGFAIPHAVMRSDVAGRDVTEHLALLLRKAGYIFHTSAEMEVVKSIKEKTCYMSFNPQAEDARTAGDSIGDLATHLLPDGSLISVGTERYRAPELLFNPTLVGLEYLGLHELLVSAIQRADLDLRRELFASIVLAGGSTLFKGKTPEHYAVLGLALILAYCLSSQNACFRASLDSPPNTRFSPLRNRTGPTNSRPRRHVLAPITLSLQTQRIRRSPS
eukprot:GHVT01100604.1.p1 GENE.GHVT01100604.1~~GHVT01100604.1.p1  ORF type:complete len:313 (+),score=26.92 GHVT01100604.1:364-1302(+)